jgi:hypothetical protein
MARTATKITRANFLPNTIEGRYPVYSERFNELVDVINELEPLDGEIVADIIAEQTADTGVTIDGVLNKDGYIETTGLNVDSATNAITAFATGGIASATALTTNFNRISVCATAGDSVKLPIAKLGKVVEVYNDGVAACDVFAIDGSQINALGSGVAVRIPAGASKVFVGGNATAWRTAKRTSQGKGTAALPAITFDDQANMGLYWISATQLGVSVSGALVGFFNATGFATGHLQELLTGSGITLDHNIIKKNTLTALNSDGTITAAILNKGGITSTSVAAVLATLDTATNIGTQIGAVNGTEIDFLVDNTAGANTVTVAVAAGITVCSGVVTGSDTLTVSVANAIGKFRLIFSSATVAKLYRIG